MANTPIDDDVPNTEYPDEWPNTVDESDSVADVDPPGEYLHEFPDWCGSVDVVLPREVARAVAHRAGARAAGGDTVTEQTVRDVAYDHAQVTERFLVPADDWRDPNVPLVEWVADQGVPVERPGGDRDSAGGFEGDSTTATVFTATAEYHPTERVPLVVTVDVPEHVLDVAGGWDELTESARLRLAGDQGAGDPEGER